MGNEINSHNKTPFICATLGATAGTIAGSKIGLKVGNKFISKNVLLADEYIKKHVEELTQAAKEKFSGEKLEAKLKEIPDIAKKEYDVLVHNHKNITKKAFGLVGGLLLAATGYVVSQIIISKKQGPKLSRSFQEMQAVCGYDSTTAKQEGGRYKSTTA